MCSVLAGYGGAGTPAGRHPVGLAVQADEVLNHASEPTFTVAVPVAAPSRGVAAAAGDESSIAVGAASSTAAAARRAIGAAMSVVSLSRWVAAMGVRTNPRGSAWFAAP